MWEAIVCISWVYFSIMRYHSLRHFPVPLVTTGSGKCLQTLKVRSIGFPLGKVVRGGESERGSRAEFRGEALGLEKVILINSGYHCELQK